MRIDLQRTNPDTTPVRGGGGLPLLAPQQQIQAVSGNVAWNLAFPPNGGAPVATPAPAAVSDRLLTAVDADATGRHQGRDGKQRDVTAGRTITSKVGDTAVEATLGADESITSVSNRRRRRGPRRHRPPRRRLRATRKSRREFPMHIVQKQGGFPILDLSVSAVRPQSTSRSTCPRRRRPRRPARRGLRVDTQKVADGIYYLTGGSHHSVAVEFKDYVVVIEAPQTDDRAVAVFDAVRKAIPGKPIKYIVNSHNHFDHLGGIRAAMAEGDTIVTQANNVAVTTSASQRCHTRSAPDTAGEVGEEAAWSRASPTSACSPTRRTRSSFLPTVDRSQRLDAGRVSAEGEDPDRGRYVESAGGKRACRRPRSTR